MTKKPAEFNLKAWCARKCPYFMPMLLFAFALLVYVIFVVFTIYGRMQIGGKATLLMIIFHISAFMFVISYFVTARSDPGSVPKNLSGAPAASEGLGHKFCHNCQVPKPERCHHCSICNKCIRNMDHHCPWVNNCIGYANKKYFLLMLLYVNTTFFIAICGSAYEVYAIFKFLFENGFGELKTADYLVVLSFVVAVIGLYNIGNFFRFHLNLISTNRTTLEDLDLARGRKLPDYDVGLYQNYAQNCGTCSPLWICPFFGRGNGPTTDGYSYPKKGEASSSSQAPADRKVSKPDLMVNVSPQPTTSTMGSSYFFSSTSPPHSATHSPFPYYSSYS